MKGVKKDRKRRRAIRRLVQEQRASNNPRRYSVQEAFDVVAEWMTAQGQVCYFADKQQGASKVWHLYSVGRDRRLVQST